MCVQGGRRREKEMENKKESALPSGKGGERERVSESELWEWMSESELSCHRASVLPMHTHMMHIHIHMQSTRGCKRVGWTRRVRKKDLRIQMRVVQAEGAAYFDLISFFFLLSNYIACLRALEDSIIFFLPIG